MSVRLVQLFLLSLKPLSSWFIVIFFQSALSTWFNVFPCYPRNLPLPSCLPVKWFTRLYPPGTVLLAGRADDAARQGDEMCRWTSSSADDAKTTKRVTPSGGDQLDHPEVDQLDHYDADQLDHPDAAGRRRRVSNCRVSVGVSLHHPHRPDHPRHRISQDLFQWTCKNSDQWAWSVHCGVQ